MRSAIVFACVLALLPAVFATTIPIASSCFGYAVNGSACVTCTSGALCTGLPTYTLAAGQTHSFVISGSMTSHPLVITTATTLSGAAVLYSGASPNSLTGSATGTITITIPASETLTTLYYMCAVHGFYGVIMISAASMTSSTASMMTSSTGSMMTTYTVTADCFGYSINGATCVASTGTALTLTPGTYQFYLSGTGFTSHPLVFSTVAGSVAAANLFSGATPNPVTGNGNGATITLTITSSQIGTSLYYICVTHLFYGTITITAGTSTGSMVSTGHNAATSLSPSLALIVVILAAIFAIKA